MRLGRRTQSLLPRNAVEGKAFYIEWARYLSNFSARSLLNYLPPGAVKLEGGREAGAEELGSMDDEQLEKLLAPFTQEAMEALLPVLLKWSQKVLQTLPGLSKQQVKERLEALQAGPQGEQPRNDMAELEAAWEQPGASKQNLLTILRLMGRAAPSRAAPNLVEAILLGGLDPISPSLQANMQTLLRAGGDKARQLIVPKAGNWDKTPAYMKSLMQHGPSSKAVQKYLQRGLQGG